MLKFTKCQAIVLRTDKPIVKTDYVLVRRTTENLLSDKPTSNVQHYHMYIVYDNFYDDNLPFSDDLFAMGANGEIISMFENPKSDPLKFFPAKIILAATDSSLKVANIPHEFIKEHSEKHPVVGEFVDINIMF